MESERVITANRRRGKRVAVVLAAAVLGVSVAAVALMAAPSGGSAYAGGRGGSSQMTIPLPPSGILRILNAGGRVIVSTWEGEEALLTITKEAVMRGGRSLGWFGPGRAPEMDDATRAAVDAIEPNVKEDGVAVEVSTLTNGPSDNVIVKYNYEIRLPRGSGLSVSNGAGPVHVTGVEGGVNVSTGNGDILCESVSGDIVARAENGAMSFNLVSGPLDARTSNGAILVDNHQINAAFPVVCRTDNGPIKLRGAYSVNATTLNGKVDAKKMDGAAEATLHTLNGSIVVEGR